MWKNLFRIFALAIIVLYTHPVAAQSSSEDLPPVTPMEQAAPVGALSLPGSGWWTGFQVVNVGTGDATVQVTLFDSTSSTTYQSVSKIIAMNASATFQTVTSADWQTTIPSGFIGSGVVNSTQPILAVVNVQNNQVSGGIAAGSYHATVDSQTSDTLLFPVVKNNYGSTHKTTSFFVQNTSGTAADINASFLIGSTTYTHSYPTVGAYKLQIIEPSDAGIPASSLGSLSVTSTAKLAGMYTEHETDVSLAVTLLATSGYVPSDADTTLYVPLYIQNLNNVFSGIQVMNTSSNTSTTVTASFYPSGGGSPYTATLSINPQQSNTFFNVSGWPAGSGSVTLTSSGSVPIIAIVNETQYSYNSNAVYSAFASKYLTHCADAPLWKTAWNSVSSWQQSMLVVQNAGSSDATVHAVFTMTSGGTGTFTPPDRIVPPNGQTIYGPETFTGGPPSTVAAVGSVSVCADQNIAVMVQEDTLAGHTRRDMLNYEAFTK